MGKNKKQGLGSKCKPLWNRYQEMLPLMLWNQQNQLLQWPEVLVNLVPLPSISNLWEQHHLRKIYKEHFKWEQNSLTS